MFAIGDDSWPGIGKLVEECGEVLQVAGKLMGTRGDAQHWDGSDLRARLQEELGDLSAAIYFVVEMCRLDPIAVHRRCIEKTEIFRRWRAAQR